LQTAPALEVAKHHHNVVAVFVFSLIVSEPFTAGFSSQNARLYSLSLQDIPKSIGAISAVDAHFCLSPHAAWYSSHL
jgi:uncharacterized membrane protein